MKKKLTCLSLIAATFGAGMIMSSCKKSEPAMEQQVAPSIPSSTEQSTTSVTVPQTTQGQTPTSEQKK